MVPTLIICFDDHDAQPIQGSKWHGTQTPTKEVVLSRRSEGMGLQREGVDGFGGRGVFTGGF